MERLNPTLDDFMTDATPKRKRRSRAGLNRDQPAAWRSACCRCSPALEPTTVPKSCGMPSG